ncbi:MAG: F0F1 ATP synthase subunit gamma [Actinobacteria bacterium]|nr:F0F1 ATP synthase subunit gamma [Actinomycetota bacterium]NBY15687.1 F0F1 ATP synthase subunit gamma [Actinomycetota bacterium]
MGAQLRVYRRRIKSVQATKKITKAMELIASSRIVKAQQRVDASLPYTLELMRAISSAVSHGNSKHPLITPPEVRKRAAVIFVTADRGLAGAYSSAVIKETEALNNLLKEEGVEPIHFIIGRKGLGFYKFRERPIAASWTGFTDQPTYENAQEIAQSVLEYFAKKPEEGGVDEIHLVYTHFINMGVQEVRVRRILPVEILEVSQEQASEKLETTVFPLYDFEPSPEAVLEALLPRFVENVVYTALLLSAASEHAARRRAMKSASDNAEELIRTLARRANQARQAEITQEISEIVGGADALASATSGS